MHARFRGMTLQTILRQHGITSTSAALATVLAGETALAAPASMVSSLVSAAVAGSSIAAGTAALVSMTKLWIGIGGSAVLGGAIGVFSQRATIAELRENETHAQQEVAKLSAKNTASAEAIRRPRSAARKYS